MYASVGDLKITPDSPTAMTLQDHYTPCGALCTIRLKRTCVSPLHIVADERLGRKHVSDLNVERAERGETALSGAPTEGRLSSNRTG